MIPYSVIIVDDSSLTLQALTSTTDWEKLHCQVVAVATDGATGLDKVKQYDPDILITDIRMPGYDGLQLVRMLRSEYPDMMVLVISGYDDFDYVRTALQLGVDDYLLKPLSKEAVENALSTIIAKHEKHLFPKQEDNPVSRQLDAIDSKRESYSLIVRNAISYLDGHALKDVSQQEIAGMFNVSASYFSRLFKRETGMGFSRYMTLKKMHRAMMLLQDPENRAADVARHLGFRDYSYFFHVYKKVFGCAPTEQKYHPQKERKLHETDAT